MAIGDGVAIIGAGVTRFGENMHKSYQDMAYEATTEALSDAQLSLDDIEAAWLGTVAGHIYQTEGNSGISLAEAIDFSPRPVTRVANYCATGMDAVRQGALAIASKEYDFVLAVGCEKMRDVSSRKSLIELHVEQGHPLYAKGRTGPGHFSLLASRYAYEYPNWDLKKVLAHIAVKNHHNGSLNPKAHFQREVTVEEVLNAPRVAGLLGLLDCCPTTDGAAAVILTRQEIAKRIGSDYVLLDAIELATGVGFYSAHFRPDWDFTGFPATTVAAEKAYKKAGIKAPAKEIKVAEVHDCFTITELVTYEDLRFCERGKGPHFVLDGEQTLQGKLPVNPSGGLKSFGHPVGATGVRVIAAIREQLLQRAGARQVQNATIGLGHTLGGPGSIACVAILKQP